MGWQGRAQDSTGQQRDETRDIAELYNRVCRVRRFDDYMCFFFFRPVMLRKSGICRSQLLCQKLHKCKSSTVSYNSTRQHRSSRHFPRADCSEIRGLQNAGYSECVIYGIVRPPTPGSGNLELRNSEAAQTPGFQNSGTPDTPKF